MKILMTGSSGLIGTALTGALERRGDEVIRLVRRPPRSPDELSWDPHAERGGLDPATVKGVGAAVNLAGAPVQGGRWTTARKKLILDSRRSTTRALAGLLTALPEPPAVLLSGSAMGYYGDTGDRQADESTPPGQGFLADVVQEWEAAAQPAAQAGIRVAYLRTGLVMSASGGLLGPLQLPFRAGLGARIGSGRQWMSWIMLADWVRIACFLLDKPALSGPVNLTAPHPCTNAEFTTALAAALGRRALLAVPSFALRTALGELSAELLSSARVVPRRLLEAGQPGLWAAGTEIGPALAAELRPRS
jgi:uncharacterized protein